MLNMIQTNSPLKARKKENIKEKGKEQSSADSAGRKCACAIVCKLFKSLNIRMQQAHFHLSVEFCPFFSQGYKHSEVILPFLKGRPAKVTILFAEET